MLQELRGRKLLPFESTPENAATPSQIQHHALQRTSNTHQHETRRQLWRCPTLPLSPASLAVHPLPPPARRRRPAPPCRTPQRTWFSRTSPTAALPGPCAVRVLERMAAKGPRATWMSPPLGPKSNCTRLPSGCLNTVM